MDHWITAFFPIVVPWVIVPIMCIAEVLVEKDLHWRGIMVNIGWDTAVFALGVSCIVFTDSNVHKFYGDNADLALAACFISGLAAIVLILVARRERDVLLAASRPVGPTGLTGLASLFLGGLALSVPLYFHVHAFGFSAIGALKALRTIP